MNLISRTRTHQLVYVAIMTGLTIVLSILTNFIPFMSLFLIVFLPFVAALVAIVTDLKFFPIYALSSILLSVVVDAQNFLNIIFYLLPALVSGLVIGVTYRLKLNGIYILLAITLINLLANYAIIPVLDHLYQINFIQYALGLIGLGSHPLANAVFMMFLFILGIIQASLTYMVIRDELHLIKGEIFENYDKISLIVLALISLVSVIFSFFHLGLSLVFFSSATLLATYQLVYLFKKNLVLFYITLGVVIASLPISFVLSELNHAYPLNLYLILQVLIVVILMFLWEYILSKKDKLNG
ncbi:MAG TPA: hypothetical protein VJZ48_04085 [Bacilli bacterium]|nr:hypothetical protein [Bacilli bacterium]